ncbi:MAG TPA: hypothetical protein VKE96_09190 [Vicinamibacterales bacterium]|nr:hypothetical protein [Vicinamibacterales bacterium]
MRMQRAGTMVAVLVIAACTAVMSAQQEKANPRLGKWKLKQDPPALNIMTYEPWGNGGMKVTVESTNAQGRKATWTYNTMFDGKDMPVSGDTRTETTSVKKIDDRTNEITNKRGAKVTQVIINVLSADGKRIDNTYKNYNESGELTSTTTAVYERLP